MTDLSQLKAALAGRYEVEREVGEGGMATVYLARDLKHDRRVALKVLKPELGAVLGVERFLAEIKVTANLQHPNLLPLFDSGAAEGLLFYVMPFVEGESLRARLDREKQLPIDEAVHIGAAVAGALDYAHRQGVIHRDLKPENILMHEGQPLVADFGIALAVSNAGGGRITQTGLSLGTPQYMSPEQATGDRAVDGRTDIYSLGAVTYEMLAGEAPHTGTSSQAVIARVLTEKPRAVRASRPNVPAHVEAAVEHALEKLAADRFATAKEFADALTGKVILATAATASSLAAEPARGAWTRREKLLAAGLVGALAVAAVALLPGIRATAGPTDAPEVRFSITPPAQAQGLQIAVSPDGQHVAFVTPRKEGDGSVLWIRSLASLDERVLIGTDGATAPFWSPDSKEIAFFADGKLKRIPVAGGPATVIASAITDGGYAGTWSPDGVIVFSLGRSLMRVDASGNAPPSLLTDGAGRRVTFPQFLPDGRHFLYVRLGGGLDASSGVMLRSLDDTTTRRVMPGESRVRYAAPGVLLFVRDGTLFARSFNTRTFEFVGAERRIASDVGVNVTSGMTAFDASATGVLVFRSGGSVAFTRQLYWFGRDGKRLGAVGDTGSYTQFNLSPDESMIAVDRSVGARRDIWVIDIARNVTQRLTTDSAVRSGPIWSHDSRAVIFQSYRTGPNNFYRKELGSASDTPLFESASDTKFTEDATPDGKLVLFHDNGSLFSVPATGGTTPTEVVRGIAGIDEVRVSPDGKWVAYNSTESGRTEVYVASFPGFSNRKQVSSVGGGEARWRGDGREIFYLSNTGMVMAVPITLGMPIAVGAPTQLFQTALTPPNLVFDEWAVTRDGKRFLLHEFSAIAISSQARFSAFTVVVNWTNALKAK